MNGSIATTTTIKLYCVPFLCVRVYAHVFEFTSPEKKTVYIL